MIDNTGERRKYNRRCPESLIGVTVSETDTDDMHLGVVDNLSIRGIGITAPVFVAPGTHIKLTLTTFDDDAPEPAEEYEFEGTVCWCVREELSDSVCHIGIQRAEDS